MMFTNVIKMLDIDYLQRGLRVAIVMVMATLFYKWFQLSYGYWLVLTAVIVIQANVGATIKRAKDRTFGTILGVLAGVSILTVIHLDAWLLMPLVIILVFLTVYLSTTSYNYAIFFGSILLVLLLGSNASSPWHFGMLRIMDTAIGSMIGLLASYFLWPNCARLELYAGLSFALEKAHEHFQAITQAYINNAFDEHKLLEKKIANEEALQKGKKLLEEFSYEPSYMRISNEAVNAILLNLETLFEILQSLTLVARYRPANLQVETKVKEFVQQISQMFTEIAKVIKNEKTIINIGQMQFFLEHLDQHLTELSNIRNVLASQSIAEYNPILFNYNLKRVGFELKYLFESTRQLARSLSS